MATIKIKFKDTITMPSSATTFNITFTTPENSDEYNKMIVNYNNEGGINYYYNSSVTAVYNSSGWRSYVYKVIEIDTTQANFNAFITAMKSNIEGVELEAGTYFWNENLLNFPTLTQTLNFISHSRVFNSMTFYYNDSSSGGLNYDTNEAYHWYSYADNLWMTAQYKRIVTTENQYVSYDFYNYAILGGNLVKQTAPIIESGTYIFNDTLSSTFYVEETLIFTSNSQSFISINYKNNSEILNFNKSDRSTLEVYNKTWIHNENKTIVVETDQVVPTRLKTFFDNNATKQTTPTGTNKLKFGEITPTKLYMGETEVTKIYMGETLVYEK